MKSDRGQLNDHERALVDGLFFYSRKETSTKDVQEHYKSSGFDPAALIRPGLNERVKKVLPPGDARVGRLAGLALFLAGVVLLVWSAFAEPVIAGGAVAAAIVSLVLGAILQIPGWLFRSRMDWGFVAAALLLLPALFVSLGTAAFLWWGVGTDDVELPWMMVGALTALAFAFRTGPSTA